MLMKISQVSRRVVLMLIFVLTIPALAASNASWSPPTNLTGDHLMEVFRFISGADGTQALFYPIFDLSTNSGTLWARVRAPHGVWSAAEDLSGAVMPVTVFGLPYWDVGVSPDGIVWAIWSVKDSSKPAGADIFVMESHRDPHGSWSTAQTLSGGVTTIRSVDFHTGPDGHVAAAWVECDSTSSDLSMGNCNVNTRYRFPGAPDWEPTIKVDQSAAGVAGAAVRVGPGGMAVVVWNEANAPGANQWVVMAKGFDPATSWEPNPTAISGVLQPRDDRWLAEPVMDLGGTFVAAWTAVTSADPNKDANYSNTRTATGVWGIPVQISKAYPAHNLERPKLAVGHNGTLVGAWVANETGSMSKSNGLYANARDPGNPWGAEQRVSPLEDNLSLYGLEVWPDGTAVVLWKTSDLSRSATEDEGVFWSARHAGSWGIGGGGEGQLGSWVDELNGAALKLGNDGSATALWAVKDASKPSGKQGVVLAASWPPGGPWSAAEIVGRDYERVATWEQGLALGPGEQSVGATWIVVQSSPTTQLAIYYASTISGDGSTWSEFLYLPMTVR
jgi:hypothetical protein